MQPDPVPESYDHLREIARSLLRREAECTLTATGLVHELFLKVSSRSSATRRSPSDAQMAELMPYASRAMRQILIDRARRRIARIRSEGKVTEDQSKQQSGNPKDRAAVMLVELDDAIDLLGQEMPDNAELVRLHLYDALSIETAAEKMGLSRAAAYRKWAFCRTWLASKLNQT